MNKRVESILNAAEKYNKLAQSVSFQSADMQVALGQAESLGNRGADQGYFAPATVNNIISDIANKFNLDDSTNGTVGIVCDARGAVSFPVALTAQKELAPKIAGYLRSKFSADASKRILAYCRKTGKALAATSAGWLKF